VNDIHHVCFDNTEWDCDDIPNVSKKGFTFGALNKEYPQYPSDTYSQYSDDYQEHPFYDGSK
jgi:hypothetical protein